MYREINKRIWDLTQYDTTVLQSYGLNKALYTYIGSSNKYNLNTRSSKWKYEILNNTKNVSKYIREFIFKLKVFYELETSYTADEIDYLYITIVNLIILYLIFNYSSIKK